MSHITNLLSVPQVLPAMLSYADFAEQFHFHLYRNIKVTGKVLNSKLHLHNYIQLWYVRQGSIRHSFQNFSMLQPAGSFVLLPPYCMHAVNACFWDDYIDVFILDFSKDFFLGLLDEKNNAALFDLLYFKPLFMHSKQIAPCLCFHGHEVAIVECLLEQIFKEYVDKERTLSSPLRTNIENLLELIAWQHQIFVQSYGVQSHRHQSALKHTLDYLDTNFYQKIYLPNVYREALMSRCAFSDLFKKIMGKTVSEYLRYCRVMYACELLSGTDQRQKEVCFNSGFHSQVDFCRVFKSIMNCSPNQYRMKYYMPPEERRQLMSSRIKEIKKDYSRNNT